MGGVISSFLWMNGSINEIKKDVSDLQKEICIIKTVLLLKNILPAELAQQKE
jgi:hypothetical protein